MMKQKKVLCKCSAIVLALILLSGCAGTAAPPAADAQETVPYADYGEFIFDSDPLTDDPDARAAYEAVRVYPFSEAELRAAKEAVEQYEIERSKDEGTLTYQVARLAFDAKETDQTVRNYLAENASFADVPEDEAYGRILVFSVVFSAQYDHTKTFKQDGVHLQTHVILERDSVTQDTWKVVDSSSPIQGKDPSERAARNGPRGAAGRGRAASRRLRRGGCVLAVCPRGRHGRVCRAREVREKP